MLFFFIKYLWMSNISSTAIAFNPVFFILYTEKSSEMFPRHNGSAPILETFAFNLTISVPLTNKYFLHYNGTLNNFLLFSVKSIEYFFRQLM